MAEPSVPLGTSLSHGLDSAVSVPSSFPLGVFQKWSVTLNLLRLYLLYYFTNVFFFFFFFFSVITIKIVCLVLIFLPLMWYGSKVHPGTFPLKLTRCTNFLSATSHSVQLRTVACLLPSKLDSVERRALQPVLQLWRGAHRPGGIWGLASLLTLAHGKPTFRRYSGCTSGVLSAVKANAKLVVSKVASKSLQNIEWLLQYYN